MTTATKSKIFNGTVTLVNKETSTHTTIKIHTVRKGNLQGKRLMSQLVGTDNEHSYQGFAFINDNDTVNIWRSKSTDKRIKIAEIIRSLMVEGDASRYADKVGLKLSKRCMRCNRKLTTPQSIEDGIGPECIKKGMAF